MQQFNLEEWLQDKSRKVVTRNGRPVRIICWDKENTSSPIVFLIKDSEQGCSYEYINCANIEGKADSGLGSDDLFFSDEEENLSEDEKRIREELLDYLKRFIPHHDIDLVTKSKVWITWLEKQGEQKSAWGEEDEANMDAVWKACGQVYGVKYQSILGDWLKSLKPQNRWKPNEKQMEALETAVRCRAMPWEQLGTLYNDLKKI